MLLKHRKEHSLFPLGQGAQGTVASGQPHCLWDAAACENSNDCIRRGPRVCQSRGSMVRRTCPWSLVADQFTSPSEPPFGVTRNSSVYGFCLAITTVLFEVILTPDTQQMLNNHLLYPVQFIFASTAKKYQLNINQQSFSCPYFRQNMQSISYSPSKKLSHNFSLQGHSMLR